MFRLRLRITDWPRRALILTDTPRPDCPNCHGHGGWAHDCVSPEGEYAGTDWWPCDCWDDALRWLLLPLPHRTPPGGYSNEPPF